MNYEALVNGLCETNCADYIDAIVESLEERINSPWPNTPLDLQNLQKALDVMKSMQVTGEEEV